ncbi:Transcriptional regulator, LysR family [Vibrio casei]|uniref:LysR family transcriptional regulator n=3 Tax=Vibrionaceae TaxID=641 RepID=A0A368LIC9_9VIBR|nr:LysR family transcriptional regulator [Vibrio casei]SJN28199.1 Transcriptional regulator, LysR family [Vibrio casei]HBV77943.1 LysR family transcriptional regulator [Vibrio sp.]
MHLMPEMATFVTIIEEGSFSKAAIKLGVMPSSVSRSISKLETQLQQKLIERTTRQLRLTSVGEDVFQLCLDMLNSAKQAVNAAQSNQNNVSGDLSIAAPKALSRQILMPIILAFIKQYPDVSLKWKVADHYIDPISGEVDVVIHITDKPVEGLVAKTLGSVKRVACASPAYIKKHGLPTHPDDLFSHQCIGYGESAADNTWILTKDAKKHVIKIKGVIAVNHSEIRREAVLQGLGISIFPDFTLSKYLNSGELIQVLPEWHINGNYQGNIVAQYPQSKYIPNQLKAFLNFIQIN